MKNKIIKNNINLDIFLLAIPVLLMHIGSSTSLGVGPFLYGGYAVECFFVLSGFFLAKKVSESSSEKMVNVAIGEVKNKFMHLAPYYYFCLLTTFIYKSYYYIIWDSFTTEQWAQYLNNFLIESLWLNGIFYGNVHVNGPAWYISALLIGTFIVTIIYLFLKKILKEKNNSIGIWSVGIAFLIYLNVFKTTNPAIERMVRTVISLLVGMYAWDICIKIERFIRGKKKVVWDLAEGLLVFYIIVCLWPNDKILIDRRWITVFFAMLLILQYCESSHLDSWFNCRFVGYLGKISLPIYLGQMLILCKYAFNPGFDINEYKISSYILLSVATIVWAVIIDKIILIVKNKKNILNSLSSINPKYLLMFSCLLFVLSFLNEKVFFNFNEISLQGWILYISCKILLLAIEVIVPQYLLIKLRKGINKEFLKTWAILFCSYFVVLCLTWPGNWNNDEFLILGTIEHFAIQYHQSFLTNIFYILCIMIYPSCGVIIFFQCIICALIGAYTFDVLKLLNEKFAKLIFIGLLAPVTIYHVLYPLRVTLYSFTLVLLLALCMKVLILNSKILKKHIIGIGILIAVLSIWRTESRFFIIVFPLLIYAKMRKQRNKGELRLFLLATFVPFIIMSYINSFADKKTSQDATLNTFVTGISTLLNEDEIKTVRNFETVIQPIDKIMDVSELVNNASATDLYEVYFHIAPYEYTQEEYKECLKSIAELIICNPIKYMEAKYPLFAHSVALPGKWFWVSPAKSVQEVIDITNQYGVSSEIVDIYKPINESVRSKVLYMLTGMYMIEGSGINAYSIIWCLWIPIVFLFVSGIILFISKQWFGLLLDVIVIIDFMLVYLTAPSTNSMYFYPFFLTGIMLFIYCLGTKGKNNEK